MEGGSPFPSVADRVLRSSAGASRGRWHRIFARADLLSHLGAGALGALIVVSRQHSESNHCQTPQTPDPQRGHRAARRCEAPSPTPKPRSVSRPGDTSGWCQDGGAARSVRDLGEAQAQLAAETKSPPKRAPAAPRVAGRTLIARLAKLEQAVGGSIRGKPGNPPRRRPPRTWPPSTEAARLAQRLDTLKGEVEERMRGAASPQTRAAAGRLAALDKELQAISQERGGARINYDPRAPVARLAGLKRVMDRGEPSGASSRL